MIVLIHNIVTYGNNQYWRSTRKTMVGISGLNFGGISGLNYSYKSV